MRFPITFRTSALLLILACCWQAAFADEERVIDASDPTKIYTFLGGGLKYNDYTNGESMIEARITGNVGLSDTDMILFEGGYGWHDGDLVPGDDQGFTNVRIRWFHLFGMNYDLDRGYRGMGTQIDLQFAGQLKGTDGQNVLSGGIMPTWAINPEWDLYLMLSAVGAWDKNFGKFNGVGLGFAPRFVFSTFRWWPGAQIQLTADVKRFFTGTLDGEGDITVEINVGGEITPTVMWDVFVEKNFKLDLTSFQRGPGTGLENDWNLFLNVTSYF